MFSSVSEERRRGISPNASVDSCLSVGRPQEHIGAHCYNIVNRGDFWNELFIAGTYCNNPSVYCRNMLLQQFEGSYFSLICCIGSHCTSGLGYYCIFFYFLLALLTTVSVM
jgi:hypothetical protein